MAMIVVVAYDVASDSRRARLAAALAAWGYRLEESVFQLRLDSSELDEVRETVREVIDADDDVVHVFPMCATCAGRAEVLGTAPAPEDGSLYRGLW